MTSCSHQTNLIARVQVELEALAPLATVKAVSDFFGVHPRTVRNWVAAGRLMAFRTSALKGRIRIPRQAIAEMLAASV